MIRVTQTENESCTVVTIDGHLSGDGVPVVEICCSDAQSSGKPVQLFLRDVATVDSAGQLLLRRLVGRGVRLQANGVYTSYLVQALSLNGTAPESCSANR